jgi:hypothetical protein
MSTTENDNEQCAKSYNPNLTSSMQYFDLDGLTKEEIILKYEELLYKREKQIKDISIQIGNINEKYFPLHEQVEQLLQDIKDLNLSIVKSNSILEDERTNKELKFIQLSHLQDENDRLTQMIKMNCTDATKVNVGGYSSSNIEQHERKRTRSVDPSLDRANSNMSKKYDMINNIGVKVNINKHKESNEESKKESGKDNKIIENESSNAVSNNNISNNSKVIEKKKKKKREGTKTLNSNKNKKLASDKLEYESVFG